MSIFGSKTQASEEFTTPLFEGYGVEENGDLIAVQESHDDSLHVIKALHAIDMNELSMRSDVKQLTESGAEESAISSRMEEYEIVSESAVKDAWAKVETFLKNLWGKIQAFFRSVLAHIDGFVRSNEAFAKKYETQLGKLDLSGYTREMYKYSNLDGFEFQKDFSDEVAAEITSDMNGASAEKLKSAIEEIKAGREEEISGARGHVVGKGSLTAAEYKEALFAHYRSGARSKSDKSKEAINVSEMLTALKGSKKMKDEAGKAAKKFDEDFKKALKKVSEFKTKVKSDSKKEGGDKAVASLTLEATRLFVNMFTAGRDITLTNFRAWRQATAERDSAYKSALVGALSYKAEKK